MSFWQYFYRIILLFCSLNVVLISANKCHVGWSYLPSTGFCYGKSAGSTVSITWTEAEKRCQAQGGHIVTMTSAAEWRHILSYFHVKWRNTWLGVWSDNLPTRQFHTIDGTKFQAFTRYCNGWMKASGKRCMGLGYDGVSVCLFDQHCVSDNNMQLLCKAPPMNALREATKHYKCKLGWSYLPSTGYCYGKGAGSTTSITYADAENRCQAEGGHIVNLESLTEFRHVYSYFYVSFRNTWLGIWTENLRSGVYHTTDGKPADFIKYDRWCTGWNKAAGRRCIALGYDGTSVCFFDQHCEVDNNAQLLCKAKPEIVYDDPKPPVMENSEPESNPPLPSVPIPSVSQIYETVADPELPTIPTIATTRKMSCYI